MKQAISKIQRLVLKQRVVPYVGAARMAVAGVMFYSSPMSLMLMGLTTYQLVIKPWAVAHTPWLTLWVFLGLLVIPAIILLILEWKFVIPSVYSASNAQSAAHNSPIYKDTQKIIKLLKEMKNDK